MAEHHHDAGGGGDRGFPAVLDADRWLLDRQLIDVDGVVAGKVDDLEFSDPVAGEPPILVGLPCGPAAMGPRIGGRLGVWWSAIGLRLRSGVDDAPIRVPVEVVDGYRSAGLRLRAPREAVGTQSPAVRAREKIVQRIPGSRR